MIDPRGGAAVSVLENPVLDDADDQPPAGDRLPPAVRAALLDPAAWQDGLHKFSLATNLAVALVDGQGRALTYRNPRPLWSLFRDWRPAAADECLFALSPIGPCQCVARAFETGRRALARDRTGLVHFAIPLVLGENRLGALVAGQVFTQYPEQLAIQHVAKQFGLSPERVWQQARLEQPVKRATLEVYADLLAMLGQTFLQGQYHALTEADRLAEMTRMRDQAVVEITERRKAQAARNALHEQLATELAATQHLQETSTRLIQEGDVEALYHQILDAAMGIMRSDMASLQALDEGQDALRMLASRGFEPVFAQTFEWVRLVTKTSCSAARRWGRRVVVPDVETCDFIVGTPALQDHRQTGIRAVQSTPLVSRGGRMLGVISTHWRTPHEPAERDLRLLDILARQAADLMERAQAEEALREADRRKTEFLSLLAHELRNPLAPIRNALQFLRLTEGAGQAVQSACEVMERQVGQMVRLIDDLLDVSRISRGRIELRKQRIELASAVRYAVEAARPLAEDRDQELTVTLPREPVYLDADPTRLAQIVGNLLSNACKFTARGGRIGLTVEVEEDQVTGGQGDKVTKSGDVAADESPGGRNGGSSPGHPLTLSPCQFAVLRVRDTGVGIAPDQLLRIFDMFVQVDVSLERAVSGLGIGLTLVKTLVELSGGTVEVHSAGVGQGSEFVVRLPIALETLEPPSPPPAAGDPTATTSRRILVVDDNRDSAESLALLLNLTGHETHTAYDGLETIEAASLFRPDVVLLDIGLPKLNGYEAARRIRQQPWGQDMLLVALTGWGQEEDRKKSQAAGFDRHLVKPVDYDALCKLLAETRPGGRGTPSDG